MPPLSDQDKARLGHEAARTRAEIYRLEQEAKFEAEKYKNMIKGCAARLADLDAKILGLDRQESLPLDEIVHEAASQLAKSGVTGIRVTTAPVPGAEDLLGTSGACCAHHGRYECRSKACCPSCPRCATCDLPCDAVVCAGGAHCCTSCVNRTTRGRKTPGPASGKAKGKRKANGTTAEA